MYLQYLYIKHKYYYYTCVGCVNLTNKLAELAAYLNKKNDKVIDAIKQCVKERSTKL